VSNPNVVEITDANFSEQALASPVPVLIDFGAAWCAPCRTIAPHVDALADAHVGRLRVGMCDVDANRELTARFDVRSVPTLLVLKEGRVVGQLVGAAPRARIEALIARVI
jgi:thioredoxin 1